MELREETCGARWQGQEDLLNLRLLVTRLLCAHAARLEVKQSMCERELSRGPRSWKHELGHIFDRLRQALQEPEKVQRRASFPHSSSLVQAVFAVRLA